MTDLTLSPSYFLLPRETPVRQPKGFSIFTFIEKAEKALEDANNSIAVMKTKFADVLRYFGEDPEMTPQAFFNTLVSFMKVRGHFLVYMRKIFW